VLFANTDIGPLSNCTFCIASVLGLRSVFYLRHPSSWLRIQLPSRSRLCLQPVALQTVSDSLDYITDFFWWWKQFWLNSLHAGTNNSWVTVGVRSRLCRAWVQYHDHQATAGVL